MKKVSILCLVLLLISCMSLSAWAANGGFVASPSVNQAPTLVSFTPASSDCTAELVITSYADRNTLGAAGAATMEAAYDSIKNVTNLTSLNASLSTLASKGNIATESLAVSDLFDMSTENCDDAAHVSGHGPFTITLKAETINDFVGLLHYVDGQWELISDATAKDDQLTFKVDSFSPFAIVVNADADTTGDSMLISISAAAMVVSAVAFVVCVKKSKEENN